MEEIKERQEIVQPWYEKNINLSDAKTIIKTNMMTAARSFIAIGFYLKCVRDRALYLEDGFEDIWEFAKSEYGLSKSTTSRYIAMNDRFSVDGNSPIIQEAYREFDKSKLQEMLQLTNEQLSDVTPDQTVLEIRGMRKPKEIPYFEIEGQMEFEADFPEILPDTMFPQLPETVLIPQQSQGFMLNVSDLLCEPEESIAISQQEPNMIMVCDYPDTPDDYCVLGDEKDVEVSADVVIDTEFAEIQDQPEEEYTLEYVFHQQKNKLERLLSAVEGKKINEADNEIIECQKMIVHALESLKENQGAEKAKPADPAKQPELPILKNNDQRAAFVDAYQTWPLWIETVETGERYYRYDLPEGSSMVVKVYHAMLFDHSATDREWQDRYREGYGRHEYYLLQPGKFFRDCETNRSLLIEKLKEIQKKGKGE